LLPLLVRCSHSQAHSLLRYVRPPLRSAPTFDQQAPLPGQLSVSGNTDGEPLIPKCLQLCGVGDVSGDIVKTKIGTENDLLRPSHLDKLAQVCDVHIRGAAYEISSYPPLTLRGQLAGGIAREAVSAFIHTAGGFSVPSSRKSQRVFVGMLLIVGCKESPRLYI